jgi:hypothetical protein
MNSCNKLILILILTVVATINIWSDTTSFNYLTLPTNARQVFMGSAADLQNIDGMFVNPASTTYELTHSPFIWEAQITGYELAGLAKYANLAFTKTISPKFGSFGFGFFYFGNSDIPVIDEEGEEQGSANVYDIAFLGNYSRRLPLDILAGINVKVLYNRLYYSSGSNIAFDLGLKRRFIVKKNPLWLSLSGNNLGGKAQYAEQEDLSKRLSRKEIEKDNYNPVGSRLPATILLSASYSLKSFLPYGLDFSLGPQMEYIIDEIFLYGGGIKLQKDFRNILIFIGGHYQAGVEMGSWSIGGGGNYKFRNIMVDLSCGFIPYGIFDDSVAISLKVSYLMINKRPKKMKEKQGLEVDTKDKKE